MTIEVRDVENAIIRCARGELGSKDWRRYVYPFLPGIERVSWCQIFALWCWRQCELVPDRTWVLGKGITPALPFRAVDEAERGDMLYRNEYNHGAVFIGFEQRSGVMGALTIDGNIWDTVVEKWRPLTDWDACVNIHPEIERYVAEHNKTLETGAGTSLPSATAPVIQLAPPHVVAVSRQPGPGWKPLQEQLRDAGLYWGAIDGDPGPMTCTAIVNDWMRRKTT